MPYKEARKPAERDRAAAMIVEGLFAELVPDGANTQHASFILRHPDGRVCVVHAVEDDELAKALYNSGNVFAAAWPTGESEPAES